MSFGEFIIRLALIEQFNFGICSGSSESRIILDAGVAVLLVRLYFLGLLIKMLIVGHRPGSWKIEYAPFLAFQISPQPHPRPCASLT
jgi:hypothetical protein